MTRWATARVVLAAPLIVLTMIGAVLVELCFRMAQKVLGEDS